MPQPRRPSARARQRRREARRRLYILLGTLALLLVVIIVVASSGGSGSPNSSGSGGNQLVAAHHRTVHPDPLTTKAVRAWIASRQSADKCPRCQVTAAVLDLTTGKEWLLNPSARDQTASIIKVDILETLMHQTLAMGDPVTDAESNTARQMIEASNDNDATDLWDTIGGAPPVRAYNTEAGLTQTSPNTQGYWGETLTSPADQIKLLEQLVKKSKLLTKAAQDYELGLMRNIVPTQNWGVTGGVPKGVSVALKNGWVPLTSSTNWQVNSIGWVDGDEHDYLIAVMTKHDPSYAYGRVTIHKISADVYAALGTQGLAKNPLTETTKSPKPKVSSSGDSDDNDDNDDS